LDAFDRLWLKPEFQLCAYQFVSCGNGNGFVFAIPAENDLPSPGAPLIETGHFPGPPKPVGALNDVMKAIDGDGSLESYFQASLLDRELLEFGAMWHGCAWSTHQLLGGPPKDEPFRETSEDEDNAEDEGLCDMPVKDGQERWTWTGRRPVEWQPVVTLLKTRVKVQFHTYTGLGAETIYQFKDTFRPRQYTFTTARRELARGGCGYVF
jgi:hypothetical protein